VRRVVDTVLLCLLITAIVAVAVWADTEPLGDSTTPTTGAQP
jgi:hypothetical protein